MFGKRLSEQRLKKGLSQYELAHRLNFSRGQIANYEQGTREPDFTTLLKLADFFQVSTDYLLGRSNQTNAVTLKPEEINNAAFFGHDQIYLTEDEVDYLRESLQLYRKMISKLDES